MSSSSSLPVVTLVTLDADDVEHAVDDDHASDLFANGTTVTTLAATTAHTPSSVPAAVPSLRLRRSKRDHHAIQLQSNPTFFKNLQTLFFNTTSTRNNNSTSNRLLLSNPGGKVNVNDYHRILLKGRSSSSSSTTTTMVQRVTNRRQAPIYVMDNFLTPSELQYFDQQISQTNKTTNTKKNKQETNTTTSKTKRLKFERSFVDNMGYNDNDECENDECENDDEDQEQEEEDDIAAANNSTVKSPKQKKRQRRRASATTTTLVDDTHRTSTFCSFGKLHDSKIAALEQRIANLLGCWVHQIEPLQLVRYKEGQFFGVHHDMGDLLDDGTVTLPNKNLAVKRRLVTLFCYLNTLPSAGSGGATHFPQCGNLRVTPQRGRAVLWSNVTADGQPDPRTVHAGEAVKGNGKTTTDGGELPPVVKYGLNIWICEE